MRGASRILSIFAHFFELDMKLPSWHTGRLWLIRLGLYKLQRKKEYSNDWIWIIDHTVQLGREKCLVILGIRQVDLPKSELYLTHEDVEPIELIPVTHSNGKIVYEQLEEAAKKTGVPRQIVADNGPDIKSGIEEFCQVHEETVYTYDIKHKGASILKRELKDDLGWQEFLKQASSTSKRVQQTDLSALAPPNQRSKARYMNVDTLVKWAFNMLSYLDLGDDVINDQFDAEKVNEKIGWLLDYRAQIIEWKKLVDLIETTQNFINHLGIYKDCDIDLEDDLSEFSGNFIVDRVREELLTFTKEQSIKCRENEQLLGSSELIESMIGKLKNIERDQVKSGFTGLLLSISAFVSKTTPDVIYRAMETVKTKKVLQWIEENIGKSVQSKRKEVLDLVKKSEQKSDEFLWGKFI